MRVRRCQIRGPVRARPDQSYRRVCLYSLSMALVALAANVRAAKRRNPGWSIRSAVRRRAGNLALPIEVLHAVLGKRRVHQLERFFGLL